MRELRYLAGMTSGALDLLMPMHLLLDASGRIVSGGPTMRKLHENGAMSVSQIFVTAELQPVEVQIADIARACHEGTRLFLRMRDRPGLTLRGNGVMVGADMLLNMGFGIALPAAVRDLGLTDHDFAPSELAMELLFLHEANHAVMGELSRFNLQLDAARTAAEVKAFTDPLTGLYNRRGLDLSLTTAVAATGAGAEFALAHLDLDYFKAINDRLGHAAGDAVLRNVARVLQDVTRTEDTAARVGGDEFVLVLNGNHRIATLQALGRRIIAGIEAPAMIDGTECVVSASIGIVLSRDYASPDAAVILADADAALYASKHAGRGCVTINRGAGRAQAGAIGRRTEMD